MIKPREVFSIHELRTRLVTEPIVSGYSVDGYPVRVLSVLDNGMLEIFNGRDKKQYTCRMIVYKDAS